MATHARPTSTIRPTPPITASTITTTREYHDNIFQNADGTCVRWHANGALRTWKRGLSRFHQPVKHGLYAYGAITPENAHLLHLASDCPYHNHD